MPSLGLLSPEKHVLGPLRELIQFSTSFQHAYNFISMATLLAWLVPCFWKRTWNISGFLNKHFQIQCLKQLLFSSHECMGELGVCWVCIISPRLTHTIVHLAMRAGWSTMSLTVLSQFQGVIEKGRNWKKEWKRFLDSYHIRDLT